MRRLADVDNTSNNNIDDIEYKVEIRNIESENIKAIGMRSTNNNNFMFIMVDSI